jgi:hypothetical protein
MAAKDDTVSRMLASALGAALSETVTLPTDVAKVRLQVQQSGPGAYTGFVNCLVRTGSEEGPRALWKGLTPSLLRQVNYTSLSMVLYEPVRNMYAGLGQEGQPPNFLQRLLAGGTAGGAAIAVFNPFEVIKTQVQTSQARVGIMEVASRVWSRDGIAGFWAGVKPNIMRTFLVNAAELGTYDEAKSRLQPHLGNGLVTHVASSGIAGFASACTSTPADVIKTRLMNAAGGEKAYSGVIHAFTSILKEEGPSALYKGFLPIVTRKLIWCTIFFVSYEQLRSEFNRHL